MNWLAAYAAIVGTLAVVLQALRTYWMWRERRRRTELALARLKDREAVAFPIFHGDPLFVGQVGWRPESSGQTVGTCRPNCIAECPGGSQSGRDLTSPDPTD